MMLLGEGLEGVTAAAAAAGVDALAGVLFFFDFFSPVATVTKFSGNKCITASVRRQLVTPGVDADATGAGEEGGAAF